MRFTPYGPGEFADKTPPTPGIYIVENAAFDDLLVWELDPDGEWMNWRCETFHAPAATQRLTRIASTWSELGMRGRP